MREHETLQRAGEVSIETLKLLSTNNTITDLEEFMIELNIYEDIFNNFLRGDIVISDSRNLIKELPIVGEEYLIVKLRTPTFPDAIFKTFRVIQLTDRFLVKDNNTQTYILHFISQEVIADINLPLYRSFEGNIDDVVIDIFREYILMNRHYETLSKDSKIQELDEVANLKVIDETSNRVKFVSPGWTPFKCINWLASKSISKHSKACNYLFWESNKAFYFGSIDSIFDYTNKSKNYLGDYTIAVSNLGDKKENNIQREMLIAEYVEMTNTTDHIKNYTNGYLANRLITLDVFNKVYKLTDYDHVTSYSDYFHTSGEKAVPVFANNSLRNPAASVHFYPINPKLFTDFTDNVNEKIDIIYGNRKSLLLELTNLKLNINIPGRTDAEVGSMIRFSYPDMGAKDNPNVKSEDILYSGYYLVTAIRHKITRSKVLEHRMICELVKDSLYLGEN